MADLFFTGRILPLRLRNCLNVPPPSTLLRVYPRSNGSRGWRRSSPYKGPPIHEVLLEKVGKARLEVWARRARSCYAAERLVVGKPILRFHSYVRQRTNRQLALSIVMRDARNFRGVHRPAYMLLCDVTRIPFIAF